MEEIRFKIESVLFTLFILFAGLYIVGFVLLKILNYITLGWLWVSLPFVMLFWIVVIICLIFYLTDCNSRFSVGVFIFTIAVAFLLMLLAFIS